MALPGNAADAPLQIKDVKLLKAELAQKIDFPAQVTRTAAIGLIADGLRDKKGVEQVKNTFKREKAEVPHKLETRAEAFVALVLD